MTATRGTTALAVLLTVWALGATACDRAMTEALRLHERLETVATAWESSRAPAVWNRSVVVDGDALLEVVTRWEAPRETRDLVLRGEVEVADAVAALAEDGDNGEVTYTDGGAAQRVRTVGVVEALEALQTDRVQRCPDPEGCGPAVVTAVAPDRTTIPTSRGVAEVPAWRLTVEGEDAPLLVPSVAELVGPREVAASLVLPPEPEDTGSGLRIERRGGRTLDVLASVGACSEAGAPSLVERRTVVVVAYTSGGPGDGNCATVQVDIEVSVVLEDPIGDRPVVGADGHPLLPPRRPLDGEGRPIDPTPAPT